MIDLKLEIFHVIRREIKFASDCLQSTQPNGSIACDVIANCLDFLREQRSKTECMKYVI